MHVARLKSDAVSDKYTITENDIESIGWAEIYESSTSAKASGNSGSESEVSPRK